MFKILELYSAQRRPELQTCDLESLCFIRDDVVEHFLCKNEEKKATAKEVLAGHELAHAHSLVGLKVKNTMHIEHLCGIMFYHCG